MVGFELSPWPKLIVVILTVSVFDKLHLLCEEVVSNVIYII